MPVTLLESFQACCTSIETDQPQAWSKQTAHKITTIEQVTTAAPSDSSLQPKTMQDAALSVPSPVAQDAMFFTLLNRDVRMSIYDFLYGWLSPLPYKKRWQKENDCRGMVLACKQANLVSCCLLERVDRS